MEGMKEALGAIFQWGIESNKMPFYVQGIPYPIAFKFDGIEIKSLEEHLEKPIRVRADEHTIDVDCFCGYAEKFNTGRTQIVAALAQRMVTACLDYHDISNLVTDPSWCSHRVTLHLRHSPEFAAWMKLNKVPMSQEAFAQHIEDLAYTVIEPDSAAIVDLALNFHSTTDVVFASKVNRTSGDTVLTYSQDSSTKDQMKVPNKILIYVPVYESSNPIQILAHLRYRNEGGVLKWHYALEQVERHQREAFTSVLSKIENELGVRPMLAP